MPSKAQNKSKRNTRPNGTIVVRGQGDYLGDVASGIRNRVVKLEAAFKKRSAAATAEKPTPFADVGGILGGKLGFTRAGRAAGNLLGSYFGHGDYTLRSNTLMQAPFTSSGTPTVKFSNAGRGVRIMEREYIGDIASSSVVNTFLNASYPINPGMTSTFPWLSAVASNFDQYEMHGLIFEFRSTSSDFNGSGQALGAVIMATDYDALDSAYANKQSMENSDFACSTKTSQNLIHGIECDPRDTPSRIKFVRTSAAPTSADLRLYDLGNFQIATSGLSSASVVTGELWVTYDVTLLKKQTSPNVGGLSAKIVAGGTISRAAPLGTASVITGVLAVTNTATVITFPSVGQWSLALNVQGTTLTSTSPFSSSSTAAVTYNTADSYINGAGTYGTYTSFVNVTAVNQTVVLDLVPSSATIVASSVRLAQYATALA